MVHSEREGPAFPVMEERIHPTASRGQVDQGERFGSCNKLICKLANRIRETLSLDSFMLDPQLKILEWHQSMFEDELSIVIKPYKGQGVYFGSFSARYTWLNRVYCALKKTCISYFSDAPQSRAPIWFSLAFFDLSSHPASLNFKMKRTTSWLQEKELTKLKIKALRQCT
jgi:hypothetical protein